MLELLVKCGFFSSNKSHTWIQIKHIKRSWNCKPMSHGPCDKFSASFFDKRMHCMEFKIIQKKSQHQFSKNVLIESRVHWLQFEHDKILAFFFAKILCLTTKKTLHNSVNVDINLCPWNGLHWQKKADFGWNKKE